MATRSFIGIQNPDGSIRGIYCHYDGYPEHNGELLEKHYTNPTKITALLALGDISILGEEIGEKHNFEDRHVNKANGWTKAYHRDRGEQLNPNKVYADLKDLEQNVNSDLGAEYAYVWQGNEWQTIEL